MYLRCKARADSTNPRKHSESSIYRKKPWGPRLVLLTLLSLRLKFLSLLPDSIISYTPEIFFPPICAYPLARRKPVPCPLTVGKVSVSFGPRRQQCWRDRKDILPAGGASAQNSGVTTCQSKQLQLARSCINWRSRNFREFNKVSTVHGQLWFFRHP